MKKIICLPGVLFGLFLFVSNSNSAERWIEGMVTEVVDGDTIKVKLDIKSERGAEPLEWAIILWTDDAYVRPGVVTIRLSQIDAPELTQTHGKIARKNLKGKILNKKIRIIEDADRETPGLMSAWVGYYGKKNTIIELNSLLVHEGMAWVDKFSTDDELKKLEDNARKKKRGLFASKNPMTPWMFRAKRKKLRRKTPSWINCAGKKKTCRQMENCAQALFYLKTCFQTELDPDRDGIPCENTVCGNRIMGGSLFGVETDD